MSSTDRCRPTLARRRLAAGVAISLCLLAAGCGSSSKSASIGTTTTGGGGSATTANPASGCPFSGQTTPSSGQARTEVAASLSKVSTRKDNCIDNVQFDFTPGVPAWTVGYQTGPFTSKSGQPAPPASRAYLVVEFQGVSATYAGPPPISGSDLNYVKQVTEATGTNGADEWVISLDQELPYTTSVSSTPAYFVLGLG
jgi:hypothetical protein